MKQKDLRNLTDSKTVKLNNSFEYIFFDLDGTLTDSQEGIVNSLRLGLEAVGIHKTDAELRVFIGPPLYSIFKYSFKLNDEQTETAVKAFRAHFSSKGIFENRLYDGIGDLLKKLRENGRRLVIATSKPEVFAIRILEHFEIAEYFDFICGSTMDEKRTAKSEVLAYALKKCGFTSDEDIRSQVLMVGDRFTDVLGAREFGIKTCYVLYGYGNKAEAEECGADYIVDSVNALGDFLI